MIITAYKPDIHDRVFAQLFLVSFASRYEAEQSKFDSRIMTTLTRELHMTTPKTLHRNIKPSKERLLQVFAITLPDPRAPLHNE